MHADGRSRRWNPGLLAVLLAVAALGVSFWWPYRTGRRIAGSEQRAAALCELLLAQATPLQPIDLAAPADVAVLLARWHLAAAAAGVPLQDPERAPDPDGDGGLCFVDGDYCYQLDYLPLDPRARRPGPDAIAALEVIAWPAGPGTPGRAAFYASELSPRAYTRNLQRGYLGTAPKRRPQPGCGDARVEGGDFKQPYRGHDDERWIRNQRPQREP